MTSRSIYKILTANLNRCTTKLQKLNTTLNHITLNIKIFTLKFFTLYIYIYRFYIYNLFENYHNEWVRFN